MIFYPQKGNISISSKQKMLQMTRLTALLALLLLFSCHNKTIKTQDPGPDQNVKIGIKTYRIQPPEGQNIDYGWGYDIYISGKMYIHQPQIPAVGGNLGFKTKGKARKAAELAVYKIRRNIMPPTISVEELDSLGVLK
jgi:hypothetical protein